MRRTNTIPRSIRSFGDAVLFLRQRQNMTATELARRVAVSRAFICDIEHGRRQTDLCSAFAKALGVEENLINKFCVDDELRNWLLESPEVVSWLRRKMKLQRPNW